MTISARRWTAAALGLLLAAGGVAAVDASAAGTPTVGVGGSGPAAATYDGSVGPGNPDLLGPPAPVCQQQAGCQQQPVVLKAPSGWTDTHTITLGVALKYPADHSDDLDVGIFDKDGNLLASEFAVSAGQVVAAANVAPGTYTIEVDGDITTLPSNAYTATVTASSTKKYVPPLRSRGGLSFGTPTLTDPFRLGTEPNIAVAPDNKTVYESPIFGFSTTQSFLSRSTDGGRTFNTLGLPGVGKLDQCTGGGDSDIATDAFAGDIYMIDLGGAPEVPARVSHDRGKTFTSSCEANFNDGFNYFTDRQWLATDLRHKVMWYIYRDGVINTETAPVVGGTELGKQGYGEFLKYAPLPSKAGTAGAAQLKFKNICDSTTGIATPCFNDLDIAGNPLTDNTPSSPHYGTTYLAIERPAGVSVATFDTSGAKSVHEYTVAAGHHQVLFPTVAVDRAGTVYMAWTDVTNYRVYLAHSVGTKLTSQRCSAKVTTNCWTKPVVVNGAPVQTTVMPWVVAGDKGRIDVVFYGTANPKAPTLNYGPWYPYMAQSLDATKAKPTFSQARMTDHPNHIDPVCLSGLGCTVDTGPGGDRELGDFFRVAIDGHGRALVSYADGDNQLGQEVANGPLAAPSFADFVRQSTGPSLYKKVGNLPAVAKPKQCVTVGPHHNPVPFVVTGTGTQGQDVPALQLRGSCLQRLSNGDLRATLTVADLDPTAATSAPALPTATYLVRWIYKHKVYFAAAESDAGQWRYFSGQAAPVSDGLAIKYAYYPASGTATGHTDAQSKTITITVPKSQVGAPPAGARLSTVTGYALTHSLPTANVPPTAANFSDFPQVADVLPAYTAVLKSTTKTRAAAGSAGTSPAARGPVADVGSSPLLPALAALLLLGAAACGVRAGWAVRRPALA
ncbi:MAG TPA: hypothetical protein VFT62_05490 [Mycobacteriales bacterium]|nr:hypothetical protein [Mycobacteriales bacterium]